MPKADDKISLKQAMTIAAIIALFTGGLGVVGGSAAGVESVTSDRVDGLELRLMRVEDSARELAAIQNETLMVVNEIRYDVQAIGEEIKRGNE